LWIATQYVDGMDAADLMRERFPAGMPAAEASAIVTAIAGALDYAHDRGPLAILGGVTSRSRARCCFPLSTLNRRLTWLTCCARMSLRPSIFL
jgi:serine/threonine protein kinase